MAPLEWALVIGFPIYFLLQLALLVYIGRRVETDDDRENPVLSSPAIRRYTAGSHGDSTATDPDRTICPACGTANDAGFRYCRACLGTLSEAGAPHAD